MLIQRLLLIKIKIGDKGPKWINYNVSYIKSGEGCSE